MTLQCPPMCTRCSITRKVGSSTNPSRTSPPRGLVGVYPEEPPVGLTSSQTLTRHHGDPLFTLLVVGREYWDPTTQHPPVPRDGESLMNSSTDAVSCNYDGQHLFPGHLDNLLNTKTTHSSPTNLHPPHLQHIPRTPGSRSRTKSQSVRDIHKIREKET